MQSFSSTWRQTAIRQPVILNMSKRQLAWTFMPNKTMPNGAELQQHQQSHFHSSNSNILLADKSQLDKDSNLSTTKTNGNNISKTLRNELLAEIGAIKTENNTLLARLETMEQKLKVADELEMKLAKLQIQKFAEMTDQLEEKNIHSRIFKFVWSTNRWDISSAQGLETYSADGLTLITTNPNTNWCITLRAQQPCSRSMFTTFPELKLVYWEVIMILQDVDRIGWVGPDFWLYQQDAIGAYSFGIDNDGDYLESGSRVEGYCKKFGFHDVVGTGITRDGRLFFTLNGRLNGEPINVLANKDFSLCPAVFQYYMDISVEANFGADLENMPFKFDVDAHEAQLFGKK